MTIMGDFKVNKAANYLSSNLRETFDRHTPLIKNQLKVNPVSGWMMSSKKR